MNLDQATKEDLIEKFEEILRLVRANDLNTYEESITYEPISNNGDTVKYKPLDYVVKFAFLDKESELPVQVVITTKVKQ